MTPIGPEEENLNEPFTKEPGGVSRDSDLETPRDSSFSDFDSESDNLNIAESTKTSKPDSIWALHISASIMRTNKMANFPEEKLNSLKQWSDTCMLKALLGEDTLNKVSQDPSAWKDVSLPTRFAIQLIRTTGDGIIGPLVIASLLWKAAIHITELPVHAIGIGYKLYTGSLTPSDLASMMNKENFKNVMKIVLNTSFQLLSSALVSALVYGTITTAPVSLPIVAGGIALGVIAGLLLASHIAEAIEEVEKANPGKETDWSSVAMKVGEKCFESLQGATAACIVGIACAGLAGGLAPALPSPTLSVGHMTASLTPNTSPMIATDDSLIKARTASPNERENSLTEADIIPLGASMASTVRDTEFKQMSDSFRLTFGIRN